MANFNSILLIQLQCSAVLDGSFVALSTLYVGLYVRRQWTRMILERTTATPVIHDDTITQMQSFQTCLT